MSQAVVYLARGLGHGIGASRAFFESYARHPAGCPHDLIIIAKGWDQVPGRAELDQLALQHNATVFDLPDDGFDWGAYMRIAPKLTQEWVCFLNTHSQIMADDWLRILRLPTVRDNVAATGATGSWGTLLPVFQHLWPTIKDIGQRDGISRVLLFFIRVYFLTFPIRYLQSVMYFPPFPNPHLRSNAFNVRRKEFLQFVQNAPIPTRKRDAHMMESGRRSLTRYLRSRGLQTIVVGKDKTVYFHSNWVKSATFRVPRQPNLIISDNQTRAYDSERFELRRIMERSAWGVAFTDPPADQPKVSIAKKQE